MGEDKTTVLEKVAETEALIAAVMDGDTRMCETCGGRLAYRGPGSGVHPGVFCETGCTEIVLEFGTA